MNSGWIIFLKFKNNFFIIYVVLTLNKRKPNKWIFFQFYFPGASTEARSHIPTTGLLWDWDLQSQNHNFIILKIIKRWKIMSAHANGLFKCNPLFSPFDICLPNSSSIRSLHLSPLNGRRRCPLLARFQGYLPAFGLRTVYRGPTSPLAVHLL